MSKKTVLDFALHYGAYCHPRPAHPPGFVKSTKGEYYGFFDMDTASP